MPTREQELLDRLQIEVDARCGHQGADHLACWIKLLIREIAALQGEIAELKAK